MSCLLLSILLLLSRGHDPSTLRAQRRLTVKATIALERGRRGRVSDPVVASAPVRSKARPEQVEVVIPRPVAHAEAAAGAALARRWMGLPYPHLLCRSEVPTDR